MMRCPDGCQEIGFEMMTVYFSGGIARYNFRLIAARPGKLEITLK